ncbi:DNA polymerase III subunit beta [Glutamicibacter ardleyensis]|uniref:DNA polymerase III subunit beta n=1 Tax=Glutamicibacter ardleyensis TaxID=225894 RepID=UPI003FD06636
MKFLVSPADLKEAVRFALTAIAPRPTSPIMAGVLLEVTENHLRASGSDYDKVATLTVPADGHETGEVLLNASLLGKAIAKFKSSKPVEVTVTAKLATVTQGKIKFSLNKMPSAEYPHDLVGKTREIGRVNGEEFARIIRTGSVSMAKSDTVPLLRHARLELGEKIHLMSTDRYRLSFDSTDWMPGHEMNHAFTVNGEWIRSISKTIAGETIIFIGEADNGEVTRFGITSGDYTTSVPLIAGDYPKIRALFKNNEPSMTHQIDREEFIDALDAVSIMSDTNVPVLIENEGGLITIQAGGEEGDSSSTVASSNVEAFKIGINPANILDVLRATDSEQITFAPNGPKPVWVSAQDGNAEHLVMPVRLTDANKI